MPEQLEPENTHLSFSYSTHHSTKLELVGKALIELSNCSAEHRSLDPAAVCKQGGSIQKERHFPLRTIPQLMHCWC
eukprot:6491201-Amphidinium_carterae.1